MLELSPVPITQPQAREVTAQASWGRFGARMWPTAAFGWLGIVYYELGMDVTIQRNSPGLGMSEVDCAAWVQAAYEAGPQFLLPLLEGAND